MNISVLIAQFFVLIAALPLQLILVPLNRKKRWFTPGELRFWSIAVFILVEFIYIAAS